MVLHKLGVNRTFLEISEKIYLYACDIFDMLIKSFRALIDIVFATLAKLVDTTNNIINMDVAFTIRWVDNRVKCENGQEFCVTRGANLRKTVWIPSLYIEKLESMKLKKSFNNQANLWATVGNETRLQYYAEVSLTLACPMVFENFPFDTQTCVMNVMDIGIPSIDEYRFEPSVPPAFGAYFSKFEPAVTDYQYSLRGPKTTSFHLKFDINRNISSTGFQLILIRKYSKYIFLYYLPTGGFVIITWMSFLLPPTAYPARVSLLITTQLVLINIFNSVVNSTPSAATGLTALSAWIIACISFAFEALLCYVVILFRMKVRSSGVKPESAVSKCENIDFMFLVINIVIFVLFIGAYCAYYI